MYTTNIRDMLKYLAYETSYLDREYDYDEPVGGFINNDETEYNAITWNEDPMVLPKPTWGDYFTVQFWIQRSVFWNLERRILENCPLIGEEFPVLGNTVDTMQTNMDSLGTAVSGMESSVSAMETAVSGMPDDLGDLAEGSDSKHFTSTLKTKLTDLPTNSTLNTNLGSKADTSSLGTAAYLAVPSSGDATDTQVVKGDDSRLTDARTPTAHNQAASSITSGTLDIARIPALSISNITNLQSTLDDKSNKSEFSSVTSLSAHGVSNAATNANSSFTGNSIDILGISVPTNTSYSNLITAYNDLAAKYNDLSTKFNTILTHLGTSRTTINALKTAGAN